MLVNSAAETMVPVTAQHRPKGKLVPIQGGLQVPPARINTGRTHQLACVSRALWLVAQ